MTDKDPKNPLVKVADGELSEHTEESLPPAGERKEFETEDFVITPQEKQESHVVNQDSADGFDETKQSQKFKSDIQSFSRIKNVYADGPEIVIEIDKSKTDFSIHAAVLTDQRITPKEAVQRAVALNQMLMYDKVKMDDRQVVTAIVEATIIAVLEAQENTMRAEGATNEDIKRARKKRLDRINEFEAAVVNTRGKAALEQLGEMRLFKKVLEKVT